MNRAFIPYLVSGDSVLIAELINKFEYEPEKTDEILARYKEFFAE